MASRPSARQGTHAAAPATRRSPGGRVAAYRVDGFLSETSGYTAILRALGSDGADDVLAAVEGDQIVGTVMLQHWPRAGNVVRGPGEAEILLAYGLVLAAL
jgi:hypothetical protein